MRTKRERSSRQERKSDLQREYESLMEDAGASFSAPVPRREAMWAAAIIPQIVPSVTTYGAYEEPI